MHDAVGFEERGRPTAVIVTQAFLREAQTQRTVIGMDDLAMTVITHPLSTLSEEQIEQRAREAAPQVAKILTGA